MSSWDHICLSVHVHDKAEQGLAETIDVFLYQGTHVHNKAEQRLSSETVDVYQVKHVHDKAEQGLSETIGVYQSYMFLTKLNKDSLKP
jgi:hypothetical protein